MEDYIAKMPKVELHAHLAGSVPLHVIDKLKREKEGRGNEKEGDEDIQKKVENVFETRPSMEECFSTFALLHDVIDSLSVLAQATLAVLEQFYAENVRYLELRTTPRRFATTSKKEYMETVLRVIREFHESHPRMLVKVLVSLDRGKSMKEAKENLQLALVLYKVSSSIVGVDVSGHPSKGSLVDFIPLLQKAKEEGLGVVVHACEVLTDFCYSELQRLLQVVKVDRLGHGTYLSDTLCPVDLRGTIETNKIPIEVCVSSNLCSSTCSTVTEHHFKHWFMSKEGEHPVCVSTDDRGVFNTSLTREFILLAKAFVLTKEQLKSLTHHSLASALLTTDVKEQLKKSMEEEF